MFKVFAVFTFLTMTGAAFSSPLEHTMSMKDRIRLSLWIDGLESQPQTKSQQPAKNRPLPEEIERPLRKL